MLAWRQVTHGDGLMAQRRELPPRNATWLDRRSARLERRLQQATAAPAGPVLGAGEHDREPERYPRRIAARGRG